MSEAFVGCSKARAGNSPEARAGEATGDRGRNKMSLEWRGLCPVVRKLSGTNHEVRKERDICVLHALMLERWKEPTAACLQASAEPLSLQMEHYDKSEASDEPVLEETLMSEQKEEVKTC